MLGWDAWICEVRVVWTLVPCVSSGPAGTGVPLSLPGDSASGWSWLAGMPTWCFQGKPDILFFNRKISSSIKYTWKCVWVCQLEVSCDTPKGSLWVAPWRLFSRDGYLPWHSRIIIRLLWHFLIKNKTFLTWTDKILFVLDTFGGQKVKNVAFLKWVSLFLIPVHVVWFMVINVNILGTVFTYYLFSIVLALLSSITFHLKETLNSKRKSNHVWIIRFFWFFGIGDNVSIDLINQ